LRNKSDTEWKLIFKGDCDETISSDSEYELDECNVAAGDSSNVSRSLHKILSQSEQPWNSVGSILSLKVSGLRTKILHQLPSYFFF
jgi:hypothetical protein